MFINGGAEYAEIFEYNCSGLAGHHSRGRDQGFHFGIRVFAHGQISPIFELRMLE